MQVLSLTGRGNAWVEVDHCDACRLAWFEPLEFDMLAPRGWVELLSRMARAAADAAGREGAPPEARACPRCQAGLRAEPQATSFGRHVVHPCPRGHGQAQRDGALLASRGLFRPLLLAERVALATEKRQLHCLPCGAPLDGRAEHCAFCGSPATVIDLPRLAGALGLRDRQRSPDDAPLLRWACHGCGSPLDATRDTACPQCRHPVLAPSLDDLTQLLAAARRVHGVRDAPDEGGFFATIAAAGPAGFIDAMLSSLGWGFWTRWLAVMSLAGLLALAGWITRP